MHIFFLRRRHDNEKALLEVQPQLVPAAADRATCELAFFVPWGEKVHLHVFLTLCLLVSGNDKAVGSQLNRLRRRLVLLCQPLARPREAGTHADNSDLIN